MSVSKAALTAEGVYNMDTLKDILNDIGNFTMIVAGEEVSFPGVIGQSESGITLKCKLANSLYHKIREYDSLQIYGSVNGKEVTLLNVYFKSAVWYYDGQPTTVIFDPSEIIIGGCYATEPEVTQITISSPKFNSMLHSFPLQPSGSFSKESPSLLQYVDSPIIAANDKYGQLSIYQSFGHRWSSSVVSYEITTSASYKFDQSTKLSEAISRVAKVRNLFAFFANHYLALGNISLTNYDEGGVPHFPPNTVYLNHEEAMPSVEYPFLITSNIFEAEFETIWNKWLMMCIEAEPVITLFYEIICNRSTRINRFLNLSQAIEVYSCRYREKMAQEVANIRQCTKNGKNARIHLDHRFEDIFSMVAVPLEIDKDIIFVLSKAFSSMRNYFTHYDAEKYMEPSYQEMLAGCHILELVLLAIVYHEIGIPDDCIRDCKKRSEFQRFDEFVNMLNKNFLKAHNKSNQ